MKEKHSVKEEKTVASGYCLVFFKHKRGNVPPAFLFNRITRGRSKGERHPNERKARQIRAGNEGKGGNEG